MSILPISQQKRAVKECINEPTLSNNLIHHKTSQQSINPQKPLAKNHKSRNRQQSTTENILQKLQRKPSNGQITMQSPKKLLSKSVQKQRDIEPKNGNSILNSWNKSSNSNKKSLKEINIPSNRRLNTICSEKVCKKELKEQQIHLKPQLQKSKRNKNYIFDEINQKLQYLVTRKLKLIMKQTQKSNDMSLSIIKILKKNINRELTNLIQAIRSIKQISTGSELQILNQKIYFIQTLLAEQTTEAQLMKKYYFKLTSSKKKGKIGDFNYFQHSFSNISKQAISLQRQKINVEKRSQSPPRPFFDTSINKSSYKKPSLSDYESYRYKHSKFTPNLQPLPRSSYKRDFLIYQTSPDDKFVSKDNSPYHPDRKIAIKSVYEKDYKQIKTETIDHKELDAYKDKYKVIKINYLPKNKPSITPSYNKTQLNNFQEITKDKSAETLRHKLSQNEKDFNRNIFKSEAHRSFIAGQLFERSRIKHQQLKQFQYHLKRLFKA